MGAAILKQRTQHLLTPLTCCRQLLRNSNWQRTVSWYSGGIGCYNSGSRCADWRTLYFRVPSKTTPTTILVEVIKAHPNRKTNFNAKTNPNPDLQKTCKKKLKEKRNKNYGTHRIRTPDSWLNKHDTNTVPLSQRWPGCNFRSFNIHRKEKMQ